MRNNTKYSFITPRKKYLISQDTKVWFAFIVIIAGVIFSFYVFLLFKISQVDYDISINNQKAIELKDSIAKVDQEINWINQQKRFAEEIYSNNNVIKDSIKNLFDLIPSQITLTSVVMHKNELIVQGITPSQDVYNFLLAVPLKSIFTKSIVEFYKMKDGNYIFRSINTFEKTMKIKSEELDDNDNNVENVQKQTSTIENTPASPNITAVEAIQQSTEKPIGEKQ